MTVTWPVVFRTPIHISWFQKSVLLRIFCLSKTCACTCVRVVFVAQFSKMPSRANSRSRSPQRRHDSRERGAPSEGGKYGGKGSYGGKGFCGKGDFRCGKGGSSSKGDGPGQSVLVRNLDYTSSPEDVKDHFSQCGPIKDVYLPLEYQSRKPKGFGFVEFLREDDAHYAVRSMNNSELHGKELVVMIAQNRRKSPTTMQKLETKGQDSGGDRRASWSEPRNHWTKDLPGNRSRDRSRGRDGGSRKGSPVRAGRSPSRDSRRS